MHDGEDSLYDLPVSLNETGTLYEHCVRAIKYSHRFGEHGLPLIGAGDWNDGMDRVGNKGKGESVWLAFFLYDVLIKFSTVARNNGDILFAESCNKEAATLQSNIETRPGMVNGIAVLILMTVLRLVRRKMKNAVLMPLHKAGRYCQVQVTMKERK